jgi:hypothetical protein
VDLVDRLYPWSTTASAETSRAGEVRPDDRTAASPVKKTYLHGLSSGDFVPALGQFLGSTAGLSAPVITKLTEAWKGEQRTFSERDLSGVDYVYLWVDGIHVNIRLEEHKPARSAQSMRGRGLVRRSTATSCRSTRSSTSLTADLRDASRTSPSTFWKIRYSSP